MPGVCHPVTCPSSAHDPPAGGLCAPTNLELFLSCPRPPNLDRTWIAAGIRPKPDKPGPGWHLGQVGERWSGGLCTPTKLWARLPSPRVGPPPPPTWPKWNAACPASDGCQPRSRSDPGSQYLSAGPANVRRGQASSQPLLPAQIVTALPRDDGAAITAAAFAPLPGGPCATAGGAV